MTSSYFNMASASKINSLPEKQLGEKSSRVRKCDIDTTVVQSIIGTMYEEQREHEYSNFDGAYLKYRKVVTEWVFDVCEYFSQHPTTTHAAISYLDRLQPNDKFSRYEWQMLAICCILIAAKYNETEEDVPDLQTLEYITQQPIPNETILNYELWALKKMAWKLNARTPLAFIACFVVCGVTTPSDICYDSSSISPTTTITNATTTTNNNNMNNNMNENNTKELYTIKDLDTKICEECYSLASFCLLEYGFKQYKASDLACGILYYVRKSMGVSPIWCENLTELTKTDPSSDSVVCILNTLDVYFLKQPPTPMVSSNTLSTPVKGNNQSNNNNSNSNDNEKTTYVTPVSKSTPQIDTTNNDSTDVITNLLSSITILPTSSTPVNINPPILTHTTPQSKEEINNIVKNKNNRNLYPSPNSVMNLDICA